MVNYIPEGSMTVVRSWFSRDPVFLRIQSPRKSKLGDYRPAQNGKASRITINSDLHKVEFLVTLAHEFAHAENYRLNGRRVEPHGLEWKAIFRKNLEEIIDAGILEKKYIDAIRLCYFGSRGLRQRCDKLRRIYDRETSGLNFKRLEDIPVGSEFIISGKKLIKGKRRRTRFECSEKGSGRIYTVHSMAEIREFTAPKK